MCFLKSSLILSFFFANNITSGRVSNYYINQTRDFNSESLLNTTQILQKYNYSTETYKVITKDGYCLNIFRIVNKGPPILLVHGFSESSDSWVVQGPKYSLACKLADDGYDIWLFNARGNTYSQDHLKKLDEKSYWNFSYEEIANFDIPATIDFILNKTLQKQLTYVGFSQGTTTFFVLCSLKPKYNNKIKHAVLLAPVAWFDDILHPALNILALQLDILKSLFEEEKIYGLFPFRKESSIYHANVCNISLPENKLCLLEEHLLSGLDDLSKILPERLPIIQSHRPAGASAKTLLHFLQAIISKKFQRFDYGIEQNRKMYFSSLPPQYDLSLISVPMSIFYSEADWFSSTKSVKILQRNLNAQYKLITIDKSLKFNHLEYIYGIRAMSLVTRPAINIIRNLPKI